MSPKIEPDTSPDTGPKPSDTGPSSIALASESDVEVVKESVKHASFCDDKCGSLGSAACRG